jgi:bifunctional DNase/RNase
MERQGAGDGVAVWTWEHALLPGLVLLFAAAASAAAASADVTTPAPAPCARPAPPTSRGSLVELHLAEVLRTEGVRGGALLLEDADKAHVLPLFLEGDLAEALRRRWTAPDARGTGAEAVLARALERLGGSIERVEVHETTDDLLAGRVVLRVAEEEVSIEAEAAEVVGVALGTGRPIVAPLPTLERHGIRRRAVTGAGAPAPTRVRPTETL